MSRFSHFPVNDLKLMVYSRLFCVQGTIATASASTSSAPPPPPAPAGPPPPPPPPAQSSTTSTGSGDDEAGRAALFAALNKGTDISKGWFKKTSFYVQCIMVHTITKNYTGIPFTKVLHNLYNQ